MNELVYAVIVCFNPDLELLSNNVRSIIAQVNNVVVVDNGSMNYEQYTEKLKTIGNIQYIRLEKNEGIAYALNVGLDYCNGKCKWFISLDQDSCAAPDMVEKLLEIAEPNDSIVAPLIIDRNSVEENGVDYSHLNALTAITSGCLNNVAILKSVGGYNSDYFIDCVDHELCLRLTQSGYPIKHSKYAILYHAVGNIVTHRILGLKFISTNHSPLRYYFQFRNRIITCKKYYRVFTMWCIKRFIFMWWDILLILVFEKTKGKNFRFIIKGLNDGFHGKYNNNFDALK